jgi:hypothetical protein
MLVTIYRFVCDFNRCKTWGGCPKPTSHQLPARGHLKPNWQSFHRCMRRADPSAPNPHPTQSTGPSAGRPQKPQYFSWPNMAARPRRTDRDKTLLLAGRKLKHGVDICLVSETWGSLPACQSCPPQHRQTNSWGRQGHTGPAWHSPPSGTGPHPKPKRCTFLNFIRIISSACFE